MMRYFRKLSTARMRAIIMKDFFNKRLISPLLDLLKQGITPSKLALAVSFGVILATVPVFGLSSLLCLLAIWIFRINPAAIFLVNQFAYPLQFICYMPLISAGGWLFGKEPIPYSIGEVFEMLVSTPFKAISVLWWSTMQALVVWAILMVPVTLLLHRGLRMIFDRMLRKEFPPL